VGLDSVGGYPQPFFMLHLGPTGISKGFHWYVDSTPFVFSGVYGYASDRDAAGNWYTAGSSNGYQTVASTRADGSLRWVRAVHHHDFYDLHVSDAGEVFAMGQDESFLGVHDFSLVRMDTNGNISAGVMVGTEGFDLPRKFIPSSRGWLMVGHAFISPDFHLLIAEVDTGFNMLWAYTYTTGARDHFAQDVASLPDGSGYLVGGYLGGASQDSAYLMRIDNNGVPAWMQTYRQDTSEVFTVDALEIDNASGAAFLVGGYGSTSGEQPYVLKTDLNGAVQWIKGYGDGPSNSIESFADIALSADGATFAAAGSYYDQLSPVHHKAMLVTASTDSGVIPCDTTLMVVTGSLAVTRDSAVLSQGFVIQYSLPFLHRTSTMQMASVCSLMVGNGPAIATEDPFFWVKNPVSDEMLVQWQLAPNEGHAVLTLHSLQGAEMLRTSLRGREGSVTLPIQSLPAGLYLLRLELESGLVETRRVEVLD
jgi:hypothetical protein